MDARFSKIAGLAFPFTISLAFVWCILICAQSARGQWEAIGTFPHQISNVYFMNEFGHPEIGFVGMFIADTLYPGSLYYRDSTDLWRTSDGGMTWVPIPLTPDLRYFSCRDFTFKDSMNGWMTSWNCYRTTDAGVTWNHIPGQDSYVSNVNGGENSIFYQPLTKLLFLSIWSHDYNNLPYDSTIVSGDEGITWVNLGGGLNGYSFTGLNGVVTAVADSPQSTALNTTDGGISWFGSNFIDECWQPACIPGTTTFFAASEVQNRISRSNDGGKTWRTIFTYASPQDLTKRLDGCIRTDKCGNLYVMTFSEGFLMSSDEGVSWHSIGGPLAFNDARFWITYDYIYAGDGATGWNSDCELCAPGTLWRYPLSNSVTVAFPNASKRTSINAGNDVTISFPVEATASSNPDSMHLVIRYDSVPLMLKGLNLSSGLTLLDSSMNGDTLNLWIALDTTDLSQSKALELTFGTFLTTSSTKVYLDSTQFYGGCTTCICSQSISNADSVEIDFTGCGDSILLQLMQGGQLTFSIVSIQPNPAQTSITVTLSGVGGIASDASGSGIDVEMFDVLGQTILTQHSALSTQHLDVSKVPPGVYFLRLSENGFVQSRQVVIER